MDKLRFKLKTKVKLEIRSHLLEWKNRRSIRIWLKHRFNLLWHKLRFHHKRLNQNKWILSQKIRANSKINQISRIATTMFQWYRLYLSSSKQVISEFKTNSKKTMTRMISKIRLS